MAPKASTIDHILVNEAKTVDIDKVSPYPKNPRVGDLEAIRDSIRVNGIFRPLIVQKSTGHIIAGNHTWKAAKAEQYTKVPVVYLDVTDEQASRIVLADNRTNDLSTYNPDILSDILKSLPNPAMGTGYSDQAVEDLLSSITEQRTEAIEDILRPPVTMPTGMPDWGELGAEDDNALGGPTDLAGNPVEPGDVALPDVFAEADDILPGAFGLKPDAQYEKVGDWHIPPLRPDMLMTPDEVPRGLLAWAGSATKDWPDLDQWWLYNYGIDSTSGMHDVSKIILSFYCWDKYFEGWWDYPDRYVAKMINSGVKYAIVPDYSQWSNDPRVLSLFNLYRARWLGRYMQEAGVKVIPNISWRMDDYPYYDNVVRPSLPKDMPVVALQLQTWDKDKTDAEVQALKSFIEHIGKSINPELTVFYVGKQAAKVLPDIPWPGEQLVIKNRLDALGEQAKLRTKKKTL